MFPEEVIFVCRAARATLMLSKETRRGQPTECSGQLTANKARGRMDGSPVHGAIWNVTSGPVAHDAMILLYSQRWDYRISLGADPL